MIYLIIDYLFSGGEDLKVHKYAFPKMNKITDYVRSTLCIRHLAYSPTAGRLAIATDEPQVRIVDAIKPHESDPLIIPDGILHQIDHIRICGCAD